MAWSANTAERPSERETPGRRPCASFCTAQGRSNAMGYTLTPWRARAGVVSAAGRVRQHWRCKRPVRPMTPLCGRDSGQPGDSRHPWDGGPCAAPTRRRTSPTSGTTTPRHRQLQGEQRDRDRHHPVGEAHQPPGRGEIDRFVQAVLRCCRQVIYSRTVALVIGHRRLTFPADECPLGCRNQPVRRGALRRFVRARYVPERIRNRGNPGTTRVDASCR